MNTANRVILVAVLLLSAACSRQPADPETAADTAFVNGVVYTADAGRRVASALAVTGERIVYVGDDAGAHALVGANTEVIDLAGRMLLPGLHDMHIHPMGIVDSGNCDLDSVAMDLAELADVVSGCIAERELPPGEWLAVDQWNYTGGNQPTGKLQTLRQALDAGAPDHPVILWGNDGHHGAVNSRALSRAVDGRGVIVGIDSTTLRTHFAEYRDTIGVDASGEPNGELNETARDLIQPPPRRLFSGIEPERMKEMALKLAENGITSIQDAATPPESLETYKSLLDSGDMTFNLSLALFQDVDAFTTADGLIDVEAMLKQVQALRGTYDPLPLIQLQTAKIFVDGVLEGNPLNDPPTLPNAAVVRPYKQPRFDIDMDAGRADILGYVDTASELCQRVRDEPEAWARPEDAADFKRRHGFYPEQCRISRGVLEHPADFVDAYMNALDAAGMKIHAHAIGDRAVRVAVDGFESLRQGGRNSGLRHSLAHIQLVAPEDFARIGRLGLYLAFTYAWIVPELYYDLTVLPFIDEVPGVAALYQPDSYYMTNVYPVAQLQAAGAVLVAGSDAPVDTRDPRPFVNIQQAVTRAGENGRVLNPRARIDIRDALDAYTINGARLFGHEAETGSLEVGKYADLLMIDRDLLALADAGRADEIDGSRVMLTLFRGNEVYRAR